MLKFHDPEKDTPKPVIGKERDRESVTPPEVTAFKALLERGRTQEFVVKIEISPELAKYILQRNPDNRNISSAAVETFAAAIRRGEWMVTNQGIGISREGLLNDGQHRLSAIIDADMTVMMFVAFGLERRAQNKTDIGRRRSLGDVLAIQKVQNANVLAAVAQMGWGYDRGRANLNAQLSSEQAFDWLDKNGEVHTFPAKVRKLTAFYRLPGSALILAAYVCHRHNPLKAEQFLQMVTDGLNIPNDGHPASRLRSRFHQSATKQRPVLRYEVVALYILAFNAFCQRRNLRKLEWISAGPEAKPFPRVGE